MVLSSSLVLNQKNIDTITQYIKQIQFERKIPCIIHFINDYLELPILQQDEKFQFYHLTTPYGKPIQSDCSILVSSGALITLQPDTATQMDKSMRNHIWIIVGKYDTLLSWPVLEVQPRITKLHCPEDNIPKLVLPSQINTCTEYPTWNNKIVSVAVTGIPPNYRKLPNGKIIGYFPESAGLFSDHIGFKPNYMVAGKDWDAMVYMVHNGTYMDNKVTRTFSNH